MAASLAFSVRRRKDRLDGRRKGVDNKDEETLDAILSDQRKCRYVSRAGKKVMFLQYFQTYYIDRVFGGGYIATSIIFSAGVVLLLHNFQKSFRSLMRIILWTLMLQALGILSNSFFYPLIGSFFMDDIRMVLQLLIFALFFRSCPAATAVLRSAVYFACMNLILPISEPVGELIWNINPNIRQLGAGMTPVIVGLACFITVLYLRHFSTENVLTVPKAPAVSMMTASFMGWFLWKISFLIDPGRMYRFITAVIFWILLYFFYYMFYLISIQNDKDIRLAAIEQKMEMDHELLDISRNNYEEMHRIRHETKNHLVYLKALAYRGEWNKLWDYLNHLSSVTEEMFSFIECGNDVINAVMNHAIGQGRQKGITFDTQLIVPDKLPYDETDFCSLLSNMMNNAIEAAEQAETEDKKITVQIYPQRDYLFIKVTNPYSHSIPAEQRLTLATTKKDAKLHGYGTKIIRAIAQKYGGSSNSSIEDGHFISMVMLELPLSEGDSGAAAR